MISVLPKSFESLWRDLGVHHCARNARVTHVCLDRTRIYSFISEPEATAVSQHGGWTEMPSPSAALVSILRGFDEVPIAPTAFQFKAIPSQQVGRRYEAISYRRNTEPDAYFGRGVWVLGRVSVE